MVLGDLVGWTSSWIWSGGPGWAHLGSIPAWRQDQTFLTHWLCLWSLGLCGRLGSGVGPLQRKSLMDPAGWGSQESCSQPSHPAPPGTDRTHEALTKGDSTSFGPNPEICFPGPLFIEPPSPYWGWSVIHTLSGVYNSFIKFRAGRGFNSE